MFSRKSRSLSDTGISLKRRKIKPTHKDYLQGAVALAMGGGRGGGGPHYRPPFKMVPYESGLERKAARWLGEAVGLIDLTAQPITVAGYDDEGRVVTTPDYLVEFDGPPPPQLRALGFEDVTLVEVKPTKFCDALVHRKLDIVRRYTGIATVLLTERHLCTPIAQMEVPYVH